jgi:hypothetical protein
MCKRWVNSMKSERGSASLMVILIVFTLMLFGVFALMSSYSEYKLSSKYANWTKDYYVLDQQAQVFLATLDLKSLEGQTIEKTLQDQTLASKQALLIKVKVLDGRLQILTWKQSQNSFDFINTETLWDGGK